MFQIPYLFIPKNLWKPPIITGGAVSTLNIGGELWRCHTVTGNTTITVTDPGSEGIIDLLLIGGGGSGASNTLQGAAGSGAGGAAYRNQATPITAGSFTAVVGLGGAGTGPGVANGNPGGDTSAFGFSAVGGRGGYYGDFSPPTASGPQGGIGGPSGLFLYSPIPQGSPNGGRGYNAGHFDNRGAGGGAGAGGAGGGGSGEGGYGYGGAGGVGISTADFSTTITSAGGGGGGWGAWGGGTAYDGGANGPTVGAGIPAVPNRGGGGSGGHNAGGNGGSGIIFFRYRI